MGEWVVAAEARPRAVLAVFLMVHALVWTALPALIYYNLPLDVIEAMTYGREWQIGYDKLPPLPWFLGEVAFRLTGHDASLYALSQAAVILAFVAVWMTARPVVGTAGALAALLMIDGMHYFNMSAVKFNHNVIEMPLWALAGFAFHAGLRGGRLRHWILLGVAVGLSWWAKYFVVILAAPLALFLLLDPAARGRLTAPGPWIAAALTVIVVAPNLYWLWQHGSLPFAYAEARAAAPSGMLDHFTHPLEFAGGQAFYLLPSLLVAAPLFWPPAKPALGPRADAFDRRIVMLLAFGPALTLFVFSLLTGRATSAMWGFPLWLFIGLWLVLFAPAAFDRARLVRVGAIWAAVFVIFIIAFCVDYLLLPRYDHRYRAAFFPGDLLSQAITQRFELATGKEPAYIIGSMWDGGNVAHYATARPQPRVLVDGMRDHAPWIDLADLRKRGAALVWTEGDPHVLPPSLAAAAPSAQVGVPFDLHNHRGDGIVHVGWAILPPQAQ